MFKEQIWGVTQVAEYTGMSAKAVRRLLRTTDCPVLPHAKNCTYRVPVQAFVNWFEGGIYEKVSSKY